MDAFKPKKSALAHLAGRTSRTKSKPDAEPGVAADAAAAGPPESVPQITNPLIQGPFPKLAGKKSKHVDLVKGESYSWCSCGLSKNQPWCDGSHARFKTGMKPVTFVAEESGDRGMCMCKRTGNPPYCDGTHARLKASDIEDMMAHPPRAHGAGAGAHPAAAVGVRAGDDFMQAEPTEEEPTLAAVKSLARGDLAKLGHHGEMDAMGVPRPQLPEWDTIQFVVAQLATKPLADDAFVDTRVTLGPQARKPLVFECPIIVSDMSFGALSEEAKVSLAKGAELAGTGICSGEGGMLPEEQEANSRYLYELASAKFGFDLELMKKVQAFHFKGGQGAKTGTGGHLPGNKVTTKIAQVRKLQVGQAAVSPPTFTDLRTAGDFRELADRVRDASGGIPIGFKISAQHIEDDIDFALECTADYIIIDGRGGGTGAAPTIFRDNISVPTIPALARARRHLDRRGKAGKVTLVATGGLRLPADFAKAMALGADLVAVSNSALQSIGCIAARMCNSNQCPAGIATQRPELRAKLDVEKGARQLANFMAGSTQLMSVLARACGHDALRKFNINDLTTWKRDMADLTGVSFGGVEDPQRRIRELERELAAARQQLASVAALPNENASGTRTLESRVPYEYRYEDNKK
eukprot:g957.t1